MREVGRSRYNSEQKFQIVKEALTTDTAVTDICKKYNIHPSQFYKWQASFFEGALEGLERKKQGPSKAELRKIEQLENDNNRMKDVIAEITAENITIKKRIGA
jgi:putative transposase